MRFGDKYDHHLASETHCPACGSELERVHRHMLDRWINLFLSLHRYRCSNQSCGWEGLLGREVVPTKATAGSSWRASVLWFIVGAASALTGVQGLRMYRASFNEAEQARLEQQFGAEARAQATAPGGDFNGAPLPAKDERVMSNPSPLNLRHSCAWGVPGSNPYRGTVEQALSAAGLPKEVVREISDMAGRGWAKDQVEISSEGIQTVDHRRQFGTNIRAMAFGNTLCFNTRVNFKPGHVEYASLYEATDEAGHTYKVMVPYVCQNASVLGARAEIDDDNKTPEPASWTLALLALGLLAWRDRQGQGSASTK